MNNKSAKEYELLYKAMLLVNDKLEKQKFLRKSNDYKLSENYKNNFNIKKKALEELNYELNVLNNDFFSSINVDTIEESSNPISIYDRTSEPKLIIEEIKEKETNDKPFENVTLNRIHSQLKEILSEDNLINLKTKKDRINVNQELQYIFDDLNGTLNFLKTESLMKISKEESLNIVKEFLDLFNNRLTDEKFTSKLNKTTFKFIKDRRNQLGKFYR